MAGICAVDVGTTRIKAAILPENAETHSLVSVASIASTPQPGWVEVDAEMLWARLLAALRNVASQSGQSGQIDALVVTNQRATTFLVDDLGNALAPRLSWQDERG